MKLIRRWREAWKIAHVPGYAQARLTETRRDILAEASPLHSALSFEFTPEHGRIVDDLSAEAEIIEALGPWKGEEE